MKTEPNQSAAVFLQTVAVAVAQLKQRLQREYERTYSDYPDLHHLIRIVVNAEEARARDITLFPHLLLPDMVEAHLASLNLHRVRTKQGQVLADAAFSSAQPYETAVSFCG